MGHKAVILSPASPVTPGCCSINRTLCYATFVLYSALMRWIGDHVGFNSGCPRSIVLEYSLVVI